jgi:hypothetical protein
MPDALTGQVAEKPFPAPGQKTKLLMAPPGTDGPGTRLLILHPPNEPASGAGRVYIEFRTARGWDQGLDAHGPSLSRDGVVIHSLVDVPQVGPRVWYRGCAPTHDIDTDVMVNSTPLVVRVDKADPDGAWADVSVTVGAARAVEITPTVQKETVTGVIGAYTHDTTPCGDTIRKGTFATSTHCTYQVRSTGLGGAGEPYAEPLQARWAVAGTTLTPGSGGPMKVTSGGKVFTLTYAVDPRTYDLTLASNSGDRVTVPVAVAVSGNSAANTSSTVFEAEGSFDGIHPDDLHLVGACLAKLAKAHQVKPGVFRRPTRQVQFDDLRHRLEVDTRWDTRVLEHLDQMTHLDQTGRTALQDLVRLQMPR